MGIYPYNSRVYNSSNILTMYLFLIQQTQPLTNKYDWYDSMIVVADCSAEALKLSIEEKGNWISPRTTHSIELVGTAISTLKKGVLLSSFNAG